MSSHEISVNLTDATSHSGGEPLLCEDGKLLACCENTIGLHGAFNTMMVCSDCKQIIKCFAKESEFRNYLRFCQSRHRKVMTSALGTTKIVGL